MSKIRTLTFVVLLLISAVICPGPGGPGGPGKGSSGIPCVTNPYLEVRKTFSVPIALHADVKLDSLSETCKAEWKAHGTCCKEKELKGHVDADVKNTEESAKKLADLYYNFYTVSDTILEKYMQLSVIEPGNWASSKGIKVNAARNFLNDIENVNNLDLSYDGNFRTDSTACWATISKLRSASVCSLCSGRGASFFYNNKGVSRFQYCNEALSSCYKVLKTTGRLINLIHWMIDVDEQRDAGIYPTFADGTALASASPLKVGRKLQGLELSAIGRMLKGSKGKIAVPLNATQTQVTAASQAIKFYEAFIKDNFTTHLQQAFDTPNENPLELNLAICDKFLNLANRPFIDHFTDAIGVNLLGNSAVQAHIETDTQALIDANYDFIMKKIGQLQKELNNKLQAWRKNSDKKFSKLANSEFGQGNGNGNGNGNNNNNNGNGNNNNGNQNSNKNQQTNNKNNQKNKKRILQEENSWISQSLSLSPQEFDWTGLSSDLGYVKEAKEDPFTIVEAKDRPAMNLSMNLFL